MAKWNLQTASGREAAEAAEAAACPLPRPDHGRDPARTRGGLCRVEAMNSEVMEAGATSVSVQTETVNWGWGRIGGIVVVQH